MLAGRFPQRIQINREFIYLMSTDGNACSFVCRRPTGGKQSSPSPESIHFEKDSVFRSIDPGESEILSGYVPSLVFRESDTYNTTPEFRPDLDHEVVMSHHLPHEQRKAKSKMGNQTTFSMSGKEWRHLAGHHLVAQWRDCWRKEIDVGLDITKVTSQITTPKTVVPSVYLEHLRTTFHHLDFLTKCYSKEHSWNFFKYRRQQKALLEMVERVKGNDGLGKKKSQIVVAFGDGSFANSGRKGSRGAPIGRFKKFLRRHVTLVMVNEFRTSRVCSKCWVGHCLDANDRQSLNLEQLVPRLEADDDGGVALDMVTAAEDEEQEVSDGNGESKQKQWWD